MRIVSVLVLVASASCSRTAPENPVAVDTDNPGINVEQPAIAFSDASNLLDVPARYQSGAVGREFSILQSLGGGVSVLDYDADGLPDLCFAGGGTIHTDHVSGLSPLLYRGTGASFVETAEPAGLNDVTNYSHGCFPGDYDNDGFTDIAITGYGTTLLWRNQGDGTFVQTSDAISDSQKHWTSSAGWGDVNNDGSLDLYAACYVDWSFENDPTCNGPSGVRDVCPPRQFSGLNDLLLLNGGDGEFHNTGSQAGLVEGGKGLGVVLADLDHDNDLDIYVANDTTANFYYRNDGNAVFEEAGLLSGNSVDEQANSNGSMGIAVSDCDLDGLLDIWVTNYEHELLALYRNVAEHGFLCISSQSISKVLPPRYVSFGCVAADFDLDGDEDLSIANGHVVEFPSESPVRQKPVILRNERELSFSRITPDKDDPLANPYLGRGLATGDLNHDGKPDLVFANSDEQAILALNETTTDGLSITVNLIGVTSNRDAIGARVVLHTDCSQQLRHLFGGGSYLSSNERKFRFGLPNSERAKQLEIHWPSGRVRNLELSDELMVNTKHLEITCIEGDNRLHVDPQ